MTLTATMPTSSTSRISSALTSAPSHSKDASSCASSEFAVSITESAPQHRLLYRGALSLPDSHLLLDGLTFTIALPADDPHASLTLLETPLPLALESMRGRPSLRFGGIVRLEEVHCDFSERVSLHVHPRCILTRQLFENTLCSTIVSSTKGHTELGIRISLGDASSITSGIPSTLNTNPNSNDIVVFGRPHPSSSLMRLCVARILPIPPPKSVLPSQAGNEKTQLNRPPRPDDPIPRRPPAGYAGMARIGLGMKRTASMKLKSYQEEGASGRDEDSEEHAPGASKRQKKETMNTKSNSQGTFKVPALPPGKARAASLAADTDVFDTPMDVEGGSSTSNRETRNKMFVKKAVVRLMGAAGISKTNPTFKDFFNQVYHGTSFALRVKMSTVNFETDSKEAELVDRVAQAHITLYLGGSGLGVMLLQQQ